MVYLNLQIQAIAQGLIDAGFSLSSIPPDAAVAFSDVAPSTPTSGQLWLSSTTNVLSIWNGTAWQAVGLSATEKAILTNLATGYYTSSQIDNALNLKQDILQSGTNIKTLNSESILGTGNIVVTASMGALNDLTTVTAPLPTNGQALIYNATTSQWENSTLPSGITDHTLLSNIGTNTHAQIDTAMTRLANTSGTNTGDQDLSGYSTTSHNHSGVYEPADGTILKDADIGSTVQAYSADNAFKSVSQVFSGAQRLTKSTVTYASTVTLDMAINNIFEVTLTGNIILANPSNIVVGQSGEITLIQDATGGRTTAFGTYFKWVGGTAPTYVTTASSKTTFGYSVMSSTEILLVPHIDWK